MIPFLSVLIPVYNAEEKIQRCLESILCQNFYDYEIIIIDDGSDDESSMIVSKYAACYDRIHFFRQKNQGVSHTRQELLRHATGEYVLFCDADDFLEPDALNDIYYNLIDGKPDVCLFGFNIINSDWRRIVRECGLPVGNYDKKTYSTIHVTNITNLYWSVLWNKCYKRTCVFTPNEIVFQEISEDVIFNLEFMGRIDNIRISDQIIYNYVQIGESLTRSKRTDSNSRVRIDYRNCLLLFDKGIQSYPLLRSEFLAELYRRCYYLYTRSKRNKDRETKQQIGDKLKGIYSEIGPYCWLKVMTKIRIEQIKSLLREIRRKIAKRK